LISCHNIKSIFQLTDSQYLKIITIEPIDAIMHDLYVIYRKLKICVKLVVEENRNFIHGNEINKAKHALGA
jgi:hypothetical protein